MWSSLLVLLGRVGISSVFLWAAFAKIAGIEETMEFMVSKEMPYLGFLLFGSLFLQIIGSFLLLFGFRARLGAVMLALSMMPAGIIFHGFWDLQSIEPLLGQMDFMKDIAILGGLLVLAAVGPGKCAFDKTA